MKLLKNKLFVQIVSNAGIGLLYIKSNSNSQSKHSIQSKSFGLNDLIFPLLLLPILILILLTIIILPVLLIISILILLL